MIEVIKQALEALEDATKHIWLGDANGVEANIRGHKQCESLRQAIAEAEKQEPVEWGVDWGKAGDVPCVSIIKRKTGGGIEVMAVEYAPYAHPQPKREPLTDEQIADIFSKQRMIYNTDGILFARAIEAAHGIKENT